METLVSKLEQLKKMGYNENFVLKNGYLYSSKNVLLPKENTKIDETYRIEDDSDPTHQTVIYALSCSKPSQKGVLINSHGTYSEPDKDQFISKLASA